MRWLLLVIILLALLLALPAWAGVTTFTPISLNPTPTVGPLTLERPAPAVSPGKLGALPLPPPPPLPENGIAVSWGSDGGAFTGNISYNFSARWLGPVAMTVFQQANESIPDVGVAIPGSAIAKWLGANLNPTWNAWLGSVSGGPWGSVHKGKPVGGAFYEITPIKFGF